MADIAPPVLTETVTASDGTITRGLFPLRTPALSETVTGSDSVTLDLLSYDSGAQVAGRYELTWVAGGVAGAFDLVRRNAANTADVLPRARVYAAANTSYTVRFRVTLEAQERFWCVGPAPTYVLLDRLRD